MAFLYKYPINFNARPPLTLFNNSTILTFDALIFQKLYFSFNSVKASNLKAHQFYLSHS